MRDGATDCYISLFQQRSNRKVESKISLYDTDGQLGKKPSAKLIRQTPIDGRLAGGRWKLQYRHGLVTFVTEKNESFSAYIENRAASVTGVVVNCESQVLQIGRLMALRMPKNEREYSEQEKKQIASADQADAKASKLYQEGKYGEAAALNGGNRKDQEAGTRHGSLRLQGKFEQSCNVVCQHG